MAQNFTAMTLSAATNGLPIRILAVATPGTTIHTATSADMPEGCDELYLWAASITASPVNGALQFSNDPGSTTRQITFRAPAAFNGPVAILAGHRICDGVVVAATSSADGLVIWGNVNRISGQGT